MTISLFGKVLYYFFLKMSSRISSQLVPIGVRGMKALEREKFLCNVKLKVLKVPEEKLSPITRICKPYCLKLENFKPVQSVEDEDPPSKCIFFNPEKITKWDDIEEKDRWELLKQGINESYFITKDVHLSYDNWRYETIFKAVLPEGEETVSGFSQIGHIIHLNLRDHLLDYRYLIGQVLLDKIKNCRTVVNKSNIIDNTYRNFSMELLAGEEDFIVTVKENRCLFNFDFSKVYWNPRLCKEHERILELLKPDDILFDVFCGVGPFSIPAAKRKVKVFANDLNPESYKWLNHNAKANKVKESLFLSYNQDGKDFICGIIKDYLIKYCKGDEIIENGAKIHVTMNLPVMAVEFLKYFKGLMEDAELVNNLNCEIILYVYCFVMGDEKHDDGARKMISENFGCDMSSYILDVFYVRNVAPKKEMMRVTLKLTKDIIFDINSDISEPPVKKQCIENNV